MPVGRITTARNCSTTFVNCSKGAHSIHDAVKLIYVSGDAIAVGIEPGAGSDSVPGVDGIAALGAEISAPRQVSLINTFRQVLADGIRPFQPA